MAIFSFITKYLAKNFVSGTTSKTKSCLLDGIFNDISYFKTEFISCAFFLTNVKFGKFTRNRYKRKIFTQYQKHLHIFGVPYNAFLFFLMFLIQNTILGHFVNLVITKIGRVWEVQFHHISLVWSY